MYTSYRYHQSNNSCLLGIGIIHSLFYVARNPIVDLCGHNKHTFLKDGSPILTAQIIVQVSSISRFKLLCKQRWMMSNKQSHFKHIQRWHSNYFKFCEVVSATVTSFAITRTHLFWHLSTLSQLVRFTQNIVAYLSQEATLL